MANRRQAPGFGRAAKWAGGCAALALPFLVVPGSPDIGPQLAWSADQTSTSLATYALIYGIVALAFGTLLRMSGLPSVAHGALWGVGAYTAGALTVHWGWTFLATLGAAVLVPAVVAAIIGIPAFRTSGLAFLVITIVLGEFIVLLFTNLDSVTGGPRGLVIVGRDLTVGPFDLAELRDRYYVTAIFLAIAVIVCLLVVRSRFGRRLEMIRDNEPLARSLGLDPRIYKLGIFTLTAGLAGAAGQLYLYQQQALEPELFNVYAFIPLILAAVLGGVNSLAGPVIGAYIVAYLPTWFGRSGLDDPNTQTLVYGVLLIVVITVAPTGLTGLATLIRRRAAARTPVAAARREVPVLATVDGNGQGGPLLEVSDLTKQFDAVRALDGVNLAIKRGEILGVIGPNGSGKTTLFNCVSGFVSRRGVVRWQGRELRMCAPHRLARRGLVRTFQQPDAFRSMSPRQACAQVLAIRRDEGANPNIPRAVDGLLALCGLSDTADTAVDALSYGQLRMLDIALAVAARPTLLLLDEPAAGLNDREGAELRDLLRSVHATGVTLAVVDHDMKFLLPLCDRIVVLDAGRVVAEGSPEEITKDRSVIAAYLGERFTPVADLGVE
ncbi:MAG: ABC transporter permease subunit [Acidimicrobiia bacterium]